MCMIDPDTMLLVRRTQDYQYIPLTPNMVLAPVVSHPADIDSVISHPPRPSSKAHLR